VVPQISSLITPVFPFDSISHEYLPHTHWIEIGEACKRGRLDLVKNILSGDAEAATRPDAIGYTPLHWAAAFGHNEIVCYLLEEWDAEINQQDVAGDTPLHLATWREWDDVVMELMRRGADVTAPNNEGKLPMDLASGHILQLYMEEGEEGMSSFHSFHSLSMNMCKLTLLSM
jgi:ankyrin repeat protein